MDEGRVLMDQLIVYNKKSYQNFVVAFWLTIVFPKCLLLMRSFIFITFPPPPPPPRKFVYSKVT